MQCSCHCVYFLLSLGIILMRRGAAVGLLDRLDYDAQCRRFESGLVLSSQEAMDTFFRNKGKM